MKRSKQRHTGKKCWIIYGEYDAAKEEKSAMKTGHCFHGAFVFVCRRQLKGDYNPKKEERQAVVKRHEGKVYSLYFTRFL